VTVGALSRTPGSFGPQAASLLDDKVLNATAEQKVAFTIADRAAA
jgi:hypothetical protein